MIGLPNELLRERSVWILFLIANAHAHLLVQIQTSFYGDVDFYYPTAASRALFRDKKVLTLRPLTLE